MPEQRHRRNPEQYNDPVEVHGLDESTATGWISDEALYEPDPPRPLVRIADARDPLIVWAEKFEGIPLSFWEDLRVRSENRDGGAGDRYISFNWPEGWRKIRDVYLRVDSKTSADKIIPRFKWITPPPGGVKPLWPTPDTGVKHKEIWIAEGESDCAVLRFLGFDAYTYGACTNRPGAIELRLLELMGVERAILVFDADYPGKEATQKVGSILSESNGIDTIPIDLGRILLQWPYLKDVRDLFNKLPSDDVRAVLMGARAAVLDARNEDISAAKLAERAADPEWVWDGLFAKASLCLLYAEPKIGKTTLTFHIAKAFSTGESLLGRAVKKQRVLYYSEMPESFDKKAMLTICGEPPENLFIRHSSDRVFDDMTWPSIVGQIERDVKKYQIDYVVVDTVIEWFKFQSEEMYDASAVGEKLRLLRRLTTKGITVQINHHPSKSGGSPFGSIAFQGYVDCLVEMDRDEAGTTLSTKGRLRSDLGSLTYGFADPDGRTLAVLKVNDQADRQDDRPAGVKQRIIANLPYPPGGLTLDELREKDDLLRASEKQLPTRMRELVKDGKVGETNDSPPRYHRPLGFNIQIEEKKDA